MAKSVFPYLSTGIATTAATIWLASPALAPAPAPSTCRDPLCLFGSSFSAPAPVATFAAAGATGVNPAGTQGATGATGTGTGIVNGAAVGGGTGAPAATATPAAPASPACSVKSAVKAPPALKAPPAAPRHQLSGTPYRAPCKHPASRR
jgi:hypothetical protein